MKRKDLERHLENHGCRLLREGTRHAVYVNVENGNMSTMPRHTEILTFTGRKICKDLGISLITKK